MTYNPKKYGALLVATMPSVIDSNAEYNRVESVFNDLIGKENRSPEEEKLFDLLANLLEDYERRTLPELEKSSALETVKFLMEENKIKQKDLVSLFGSESVVSAILSGKRSITLKTARKLADFFNVPVGLFV